MIAFCQFVGNVFEKVVTEHTADAFQKRGVDAVFFENFINVGTRAANLRGKPSGTATLFLEFFPDAISYMHDSMPYAG